MNEAIINAEIKKSLRKVIKGICQALRKDRKEMHYYEGRCEYRPNRSAEMLAGEFRDYVRAERSALRQVLLVYKKY